MVDSRDEGKAFFKERGEFVSQTLEQTLLVFEAAVKAGLSPRGCSLVGLWRQVLSGPRPRRADPFQDFLARHKHIPVPQIRQTSGDTSRLTGLPSLDLAGTGH